MKFELKNYRSMSVEELNSYIKDMTNEFEKTKKDINQKCEWLKELDEEYLDCMDELKKRNNG